MGRESSNGFDCSVVERRALHENLYSHDDPVVLVRKALNQMIPLVNTAEASIVYDFLKRSKLKEAVEALKKGIEECCIDEHTHYGYYYTSVA